MNHSNQVDSINSIQQHTSRTGCGDGTGRWPSCTTQQKLPRDQTPLAVLGRKLSLSWGQLPMTAPAIKRAPAIVTREGPPRLMLSNIFRIFQCFSFSNFLLLRSEHPFFFCWRCLIRGFIQVPLHHLLCLSKFPSASRNTEQARHTTIATGIDTLDDPTHRYVWSANDFVSPSPHQKNWSFFKEKLKN